MERITEKRDGHNVIPLRLGGKHKWAICPAGQGDALSEYLYGDHADRLAAYEDTGLEPEEINELKTALKYLRREVDGILNDQKFFQILKDHGIDVDAGIRHMEELIQAEKAGLLVVLPCKVGGEVYSTLDDLGCLHKCKVNYAHIDEHKYLNTIALEPMDYSGTQYGANFGAFGKTVFLTRAEAEAALEEKGGGE